MAPQPGVEILSFSKIGGGNSFLFRNRGWKFFPSGVEILSSGVEILSFSAFYQMMRGFINVVTPFLSIIFLKRRQYMHHWVGVISIVAGVADS